MRDEGDDGEDKHEFDKVEEEAGEVFCEEDIAHASGRHEVELNAAAIHAEGVVGEDGDAEDGVGDGDGEDEFAEAAAGAETVGEEKDHEDGGDEAVELVDIASEVDELLLQAGDDGGVETEGCGLGPRDCVGEVRGLGGRRSGAAADRLFRLGDFAQVFTAELAMHAQGIDTEEERQRRGRGRRVRRWRQGSGSGCSGRWRRR